jgi:hypothetical protein
MVRARGTVGRGMARGLACLTYLTCFDLYCGLSVIGFSATCTAPPASSAPPAAVAESLARADFTDIAKTSCYTGQDRMNFHPCRRPGSRFPRIPDMGNRTNLLIAGSPRK